VKQLTTASADVTTVYRYDFTARRIWYQTFDGSVRSECQILSDGSKPVTLSSESVKREGREYGNSGDLSYYVVKPDNMSKSTPLVMYVTDFESDNADAFENAMRWRGVMTAVVKCRGTQGQGRDFAQASYLNMLNAPAQDYAKTAEEIAAKYGIDRSNISIVGEDIYAGVALSAILMADTPFRAAVAVSPVTDLRKYNPVVTQRLMRTEGATAAYRLNSAVDNASKLEKKLLILHSTDDDVTPLSNTEALSNVLVESGVQFDMQLFFSGGRSMTSGLGNNYTVTKIYNFIK
ncbi:MAG: prolyl oligopeptidase family serine peptidase, partial [Paludibacteraceae bacterium]|nr:prolyl oligopeptidase family serine peptidase [Paludibacteraceae bacterium]